MHIRVLKQENFPSLLKEIPSLPEEIFINGEFPPEDANFLAVVGTRKFSNYGKDICERLIAGLAKYNFVIVSGLALGIDSIAHHAALKNKMPTVAVPGSGLDEKVLHPHSNKQLAREIVGAGGCLLSEFPPEYPASVHTFPRRNRIIAGLCSATLVIEAPEKSGALITSKYALDFNRDVLAVPGSVFNENSKGTNGLIKRGAVPVTCAEDILDVFNIAREGENLKMNFDNSALSADEKDVLNGLNEPTNKDDLIRKLGKPATEVNSLLSLMQIKGLIRESGGELYKNV